MNKIQIRAIVDADRDYSTEHGPSDEKWLQYVTLARRHAASAPFWNAVSEVGSKTLCAAWDVDILEWDVRHPEWQREYDGYYLAAIEVLARPSVAPLPDRPA